MSLLENPDELYKINSHLNREGFFTACGGFRIRVHGPHLKGHVHSGGYHYIDHAHVLTKGSERIVWSNVKGESGTIVITVEEDGRSVKIPILARCKHEITALVDNTIHECWFSAYEAREVYGDENSVPWDEEDHRG